MLVLRALLNGLLRFSDVFRITSGVRQGGLTSAFLFTIYVDNLLQEMNNLDLECHFNEMWFGALMCADDLRLKSGSIKQF